MAAVDKIYGTIHQWRELKSWANENAPMIQKFIVSEWTHKGPTGQIALFPEWADKVLFAACPFDWIHCRIKEQYDAVGLDWVTDDEIPF